MNIQDLLGYLTMTAKTLQEKLRALGSPEAAVQAARFFKTGPGQYGEGDIFLGIRSPVLRQAVKDFTGLSFPELRTLLRSKIHEDRFAALMILVLQYRKGDEKTKQQVYDLYLRSTKHINNWDLVDASAPEIVGGFLHGKDKSPLMTLARSASLWERRISIVATYEFIRRGDFAQTLMIAEQLLTDHHDLIHKAVGWMLREVGKRDEATLEAFLRKHGRTMPRTALRYAIERFAPEKRQAHLRGIVETAPNSTAVSQPAPLEENSRSPKQATRTNRRRSASANRPEEKD